MHAGRTSSLFISVGERTLFLVAEAGRMAIFLGLAAAQAVKAPPRQLVREMRFIGVSSLVVVVLISGFTGMVLCLQGYYSLLEIGSDSALGSLVALSLVRELGPVLGSLMVAARAGSAMAAELGIMRITEQIDALDVMTLNPVRHLVAPKIMAGVLVLPLLVSIFNVVGMYSGLVVGAVLLDVDPAAYNKGLVTGVDFTDIYGGLVKAAFFGLILTLVCCYKGYHSSRGARGVSRSTTEAVVLASVLIFVLDYFLTSMLL